jgi:hypothetical protein
MLADYYAAVIAIAVMVMVIPATMLAAVVVIEPNARAVIAVAIGAVVAADIDAETLGVRDGRSADRKRRCRRKCVSELSHVFLLSLAGITNEGAVPLQEPTRNFLEWMFRKFRGR